MFCDFFRLYVLCIRIIYYICTSKQVITKRSNNDGKESIYNDADAAVDDGSGSEWV